jgi:anthranilate phosphoribosyltransferase
MATSEQPQAPQAPPTESTPGLSYTKWRYHTDQVYREQVKAKVTAYRMNRRENDAEYDQALKAQWREYSQKYRTNPETQEKRREYQRQYYHRKKQERTEAIAAFVEAFKSASENRLETDNIIT